MYSVPSFGSLHNTLKVGMNTTDAQKNNNLVKLLNICLLIFHPVYLYSSVIFMIELLEHSSNCIDNSICSIPDDCRQMKGLIYHYLECSNIIRCKINCELCKEIQLLVNQHNLSCCRSTCSVITCMTYK
jgi:hypothetical protein